MSSDLEFDGFKYISAKRARELTGYSTDYIGQLARAQKIPARLVGRSWYVNEIELIKHQSENAKGQIRETRLKETINKVSKKEATVSISQEPISETNNIEGAVVNVIKPVLKKIEAVEESIISKPEIIESPKSFFTYAADSASLIPTPIKSIKKAEVEISELKTILAEVETSEFATDKKSEVSENFNNVTSVKLQTSKSKPFPINFENLYEKGVALTLAILFVLSSTLASNDNIASSFIINISKIASNLTEGTLKPSDLIFAFASVSEEDRSKYLASSFESSGSIFNKIGSGLSKVGNVAKGVATNISSKISGLFGPKEIAVDDQNATTSETIAVAETPSNDFESEPKETEVEEVIDSSVSQSTVPPVVAPVVTKPVIESQNVEKEIVYVTGPKEIVRYVSGDITSADVDAKLLSLANALKSEIYKYSSSITGQHVAPPSIYQVASLAHQIDKLPSGVDISNPVISGGSISGTSVSGTLSGSFTGSISSSTLSGTTTATSGIDLSGGCFAVNGVCISSGGGITGSGVNGQLALFSGAGTLTSTSNITYDNVNGRLGIGTTSPYNALSVYGTTTSSTFEATSTATSTFAGGLQVGGLSVVGSATSTFANGLNISGGCFAINGTCFSGGGSGTPGGANTQIQFNDSGSFGADSSFTFNKNTGLLSVTSALFTYASTTNFLATGSSTLQNFTALQSTTTNSTSTNFFSTTASSTNLFSSSLNTGNITGGLANLANLLSYGSSTLQDFTFVNGTGSSATTTNFYSTNLSTSNLSISSLLTVANLLATGSSTLQNFTGINSTTTNSTSTALFATTLSGTNAYIMSLLSASNLLISGSSTLQNFTFINATGTSATTTNFFATTASSTNLYAASSSLGALTVLNTSTTTFGGGLAISGDGLQVLSSASSSFSGGVRISGGLALTASNCTLLNNGGKLTTDSNGNVVCANDVSGSGGGGSEINWSYSPNPSDVTYGLTYLATTTNQVLIGASATTSLAKLEINSPNSFLVTGSSTLQNFTFVNGTGTSATTTNFFSTISSSTNLFSSSLNTGNITGGLATLANLLSYGSSTLQNFTGLNSTTTNSTSTSLAITSITNCNTNSALTTNINGSVVCGSITSSGGGGGGVGFASSTASYLNNESIYMYGLGYTGFGTTTPRFLVQLSTSTAPQLALTDPSAGANDKHWIISSAGGNLFIGTSSDSLNATSSKLTINRSGYVGIGTTSPYAPLSVTSSNNLSAYFAGRVGIGTSSPSGSALGQFDLTIQSSSANAGGILITNESAGSGANASIILRNNNGSIGGVVLPSSTYNPSLNIAGRTLLYGGNTGITILTENTTDDIRFSLGYVEYARISSGGNFGLGTTTPNWIIQVASATPSIAITDSDAGTNAKHWLFSNVDGTLYIGTSSDALTATSSYIAINGSTTAFTNNINVTGNGTSTFSNGLNIYGGCYAINGSCLPTSSASASGVSGQVAFFNGGSSLTGTNNFYYDTNKGTLGIGTSTPNWNVQIASSTAPQLVLTDPSATTDQKHWYFRTVGGNFYLGTSTDALNATSTLLSITASGKIGFGTDSPDLNSKFEIENSEDTTNALLRLYNPSSGSNSSSRLEIMGSSYALSLGMTSSNYSGSGVMSANTGHVLSVGTGGLALITSEANAPIKFSTGGLYDEVARFSSKGNFGLGTTTPNWTMQIASATPSLAITDSNAGTNAKHWLFSNVDGTLYIGTSSDDLTATSSQLSISSTGTTTVKGLNVTGVASSTFSNGITLSSGCFAIGTSCIGAGSSAGGGTGAVQFANGSNLAGDNSFFYDDTYNTLGIGTSTPNWKVQIATSTAPQLALTDPDGPTNGKHWIMRSVGGNLYIGTSSDALSATSTYATFNNLGYFGIGTTSPFAQLSIQGNAGNGGNAPLALAVYGGTGASSGNGGGIRLQTGNGGTSAAGGAFTVLAGDGNGAAAGGAVSITGGIGGASGAGGQVTITSGAPGGNGNSGAVTLASGATGGSGASGTVTIQGGNNTPQTGTGGTVTLSSGASLGSGATLSLTGGNAAGTGGNISLSAGAGASGGAGGALTISGGTASTDNNGGAITITPGAGNGAGSGGQLNLNGGSGGATNVNGSDVRINGGTAGGSAKPGNVILANSRGVVGIGTTTPNWSLQVASATPYIALTDTNAGTNAKHWLFSNVDGVFSIGTSSDALNATSTRFTIDRSGYVGIGTTSPYAPLSVNGVTTNRSISLIPESQEIRFTSSLNNIIIGKNNSNTGSGTVVGDTNTNISNTSSIFGRGNTDSSTGMNFASIYGQFNTLRGDTGAPLIYGNSNIVDITSQYGVAVGYQNLVTSARGIAFGASSTASAEYSSAFGYNSLVSGVRSSAFGASTTVSSDYSTAIGHLNYVTGIGSSAFGSFLTNSLASTTMVGPTDASKLTISANGGSGFGTTTPLWSLQVASETPSIAISDTNAILDAKHWLLTNVDGTLRIGTSSDALNATSSPFAFFGEKQSFIVGANNTPIGLGGGKFQIYDDEETGGTGAAIRLYSAFDNTGGPVIRGLHQRGVFGTPTILTTGDELLSVQGWGYDGASYRNTARILFVTDGTINSGTALPTSITFSTSPTGTAGLTERMKISPIGNVGVGSSTPFWTFQVASITPYVAITDSDAGTNFKHWLLSNNDGIFRIGTSSDALNATGTALTINTNGFVGIGSTSPSVPLSILGNTYSSGSGRFEGGLSVGASAVNTSGLVTNLSSAAASAILSGASTTLTVSGGLGSAFGSVVNVNVNSTASTGEGYRSNIYVASTNGVGRGMKFTASANNAGSAQFLYGIDGVVVPDSTGDSAYGILLQNTGVGTINDPTVDQIGLYLGWSIPGTDVNNKKFGIYAPATSNNSNKIFFGDNVGIGTTSPNWVLQVASATPYLAITDSDAGTNFKHWLLSNTDGIFRIGTSSDALNATGTALTINTNGFVGIGSSTPSSALTITGTTTADSFNSLGLNNYHVNGVSVASASTTLSNFFLAGATGTERILGTNNYAIGLGAMANATNTLFSNNIAIGNGALMGSSTVQNTGDYNIAIGGNSENYFGALNNNSSGKYNIALGAGSLSFNTTGLRNTAIGYEALANSSTSSDNTAIGYNSNVSFNYAQGGGNTSVGSYALYLNRGAYNTVSGSWALANNRFGNSNTAMGYFAFSNLQDSASSTALGSYTGSNNVGGSLLTFIGAEADASLTGLTNATAIGYKALVGRSNSLVLGSTTQIQVGVGTTTPNWLLQISSTTPALAITDSNAGTNAKHWLISNTDGVFSIGTSSDSLTSTSTRFIIDKAGNVGIGTTSPTARLSVSSTTGISAYFDGNVGIGTNNPSSALHLKSSSQLSPYLKIESSNSGTFGLSGVKLINDLGEDNAGGTLVSYSSGYTNANLQNDVSLTAVYDLHFWTADTERVTVTSIGNVGIGSSTPFWALQVASNTPTIAITDSNAGTNAKHWLISNTDGVFSIGTSSDALNATSSLLTINSAGTASTTNLILGGAGGGTAGCATFSATGQLSNTGTACGASSASPLTMFSTSTSAAFPNAIYVNGSNNTLVGIGTTTPAYMLQIASSTGAQLALSDPTGPTNGKHWIMRSAGGNLYIGTSSDTNLSNTGTTTLFTISSAGKIGIATTSPSSALTVSGNAYIVSDDANPVSSIWSLDIGGTVNSDPSIRVKGTSSRNAYIWLDRGSTSDSGDFALATAGVQKWFIGQERNNNNGTFAIRTAADANDYTGTSRLTITNGGNVGIGTSTSNWTVQVASATPSLAITDTNGGTNAKHWLLSAVDGIFNIGTSSDALNATSTYLSISHSTTSIYKSLDVGSGSIVYDASSTETYISNLVTGNQTFDDDAGAVQWANLPITNAAYGTWQSYSGLVDDVPVLTVYGVSNGGGDVNNTGVSIGTTTPSYSRLTVWGRGTGASTTLDIVNNASTSLMRILDSGRIGIGSSTPAWLMQLSTSTVPQLALTDASLTSNQWTFRNAGSFLYIATASPSTFATSTVPAVTINNNGLLGIATNTPWRTLSVTGTVAFDGLSAIGSSGEALCLTADREVGVNTASQTCTVSSIKYKDNVQSLGSGLELVRQLNPVTYTSKATGESRLGFIAEEVFEVEPRLVFMEADGVSPRGVRYEEVTPVLAKAIQELDARLLALESASTTGTGTSTIFNTESIKSSLASFGVFVSDAITHITNLAVDRLTVGSSSNPSGITMFDEVSKTPYCVTINNGILKSTSGECLTETNNSSSVFITPEVQSEESTTTSAATTTSVTATTSSTEQIIDNSISSTTTESQNEVQEVQIELPSEETVLIDSEIPTSTEQSVQE